MAQLMTDHGVMPLPPYIKREKDGRNLDDYERYQTVYATHAGSIAAPTAGLHFDEELLERIRQMGVRIANVTLHIGIGTFFLLKSENVEGHEMHREYYSMPAPPWRPCGRPRKDGGRVVAVGHECGAHPRDRLLRVQGRTTGRFHRALHLSRATLYRVGGRPYHQFSSSPVHPASARLRLCGKEALMEAPTGRPSSSGYRFYSYGDAMFIS